MKNNFLTPNKEKILFEILDEDRNFYEKIFEEYENKNLNELEKMYQILSTNPNSKYVCLSNDCKINHINNEHSYQLEHIILLSVLERKNFKLTDYFSKLLIA